MLANHPDPTSLFLDYPSKQEQWSETKKLKYEENIHQVFHDEGYTDYLCSFKLMVKSGEV